MFNVVTATSGYYFPAGIAGYSEMKICVERIQVSVQFGLTLRHIRTLRFILFQLFQNILLLDEKTVRLTSEHKQNEAWVSVSDLSVTWPGCETSVLSDVSFSLAPQQLLGIIGPVGSGKVGQDLDLRVSHVI